MSVVRMRVPDEHSHPFLDLGSGVHSAAVAMAALLRDRAPHLDVQEVLGEGGMSVVFGAIHTRLHLPVAVKVLRVDASYAAEAAERLVREAELYGLIDDPRIPRVYDVDTLSDGTPYVVMERIVGNNLAELIDRSPLSVDRALWVTREILEALAALHRVGVVHRDVKPGNIMIEDTGSENQRVRLIDLGIAKVAEWGNRALARPELTQTGTFVGSPYYVAPEQLMAQDVDARADIYSAGATLFHMLTGVAPFESSDVHSAIAACLRDPLPRLRSLRPDVPAWLEAAVDKSMARARENRFEDADAMRAALQPPVSSLEVVPAPGPSLGHADTVRAPVELSSSAVVSLPATALADAAAGAVEPSEAPLSAAPGQAPSAAGAQVLRAHEPQRGAGHRPREAFGLASEPPAAGTPLLLHVDEWPEGMRRPSTMGRVAAWTCAGAVAIATAIWATPTQPSDAPREVVQTVEDRTVPLPAAVQLPTGYKPLTIHELDESTRPVAPPQGSATPSVGAPQNLAQVPASGLGSAVQAVDGTAVGEAPAEVASPGVDGASSAAASAARGSARGREHGSRSRHVSRREEPLVERAPAPGFLLQPFLEHLGNLTREPDASGASEGEPSPRAQDPDTSSPVRPREKSGPNLPDNPY